MLVQTSTPRPCFDASRHPRYLYIHTLRKPGVSDGEVFFAGPTDPEHGLHGTKQLDPVQTFPIQGETSFEACEYVVPFWELFQRPEHAKPIMYDGMPIEKSGVRAGNIRLTRYCTAGFGITAKSAYRANPHTYEEQIVAFRIVMPVTGGGVLRLADSTLDIANSTFDPWAPNPTKQLPGGKVRPDLELRDAYNRTHCLGGSGMDRLRAKRIAEAEAGMALQEAEGEQTLEITSAEQLRALPPKRR